MAGFICRLPDHWVVWAVKSLILYRCVHNMRLLYPTTKCICYKAQTLLPRPHQVFVIRYMPCAWTCRPVRAYPLGVCLPTYRHPRSICMFSYEHLAHTLTARTTSQWTVPRKRPFQQMCAWPCPELYCRMRTIREPPPQRATKLKVDGRGYTMAHQIRG